MIKIASEMLSGLKASPVLLALILLNMMMIGASLWFLKALAAAQASRFDVLMKACISKIP
jgi:hypothetical protein